MGKFTISNIRVMDASKSVIFSAIVLEIAGFSFWSKRFLAISSNNQKKSLEVGDKKWLKIKPLGRPRMLMEVVQIDAPNKLVVNYTDGDCIG